jgi:hypothetical protein
VNPLGCLDCSLVQLSGESIGCQKGLSLDLGNTENPEECLEGNRQDNFFGKTYGMKRMISLVLIEVAKSLSLEELNQIEREPTVTNQILLTIDTYEKKIASLGIEKPEHKDIQAGQTCYRCIHSSSSEDHLFIQCSYHHNYIGEELHSCESIKKEWVREETMIKKIGLSHFLDLVLQYNSSLWLYVNDDTTAGDKWIAILDTYEKTIEQKVYRVKKLNRIIKRNQLSIEDMVKKIKNSENPKEALEDGIVY